MRRGPAIYGALFATGTLLGVVLTATTNPDLVENTRCSFKQLTSVGESVLGPLLIEAGYPSNDRWPIFRFGENNLTEREFRLVGFLAQEVYRLRDQVWKEDSIANSRNVFMKRLNSMSDIIRRSGGATNIVLATAIDSTMVSCVIQSMCIEDTARTLRLLLTRKRITSPRLTLDEYRDALADDQWMAVDETDFSKLPDNDNPYDLLERYQLDLDAMDSAGLIPEEFDARGHLEMMRMDDADTIIRKGSVGQLVIWRTFLDRTLHYILPIAEQGIVHGGRLSELSTLIGFDNPFMKARAFDSDRFNEWPFLPIESPHELNRDLVANGCSCFPWIAEEYQRRIRTDSDGNQVYPRWIDPFGTLSEEEKEAYMSLAAR